MRIESVASSNISPLLPTNRTERTAPASGSADAVELSPAGRTFLSARQSYAALPPVRQDLVGRYQGQVAAGSYQVDADDCAAAMIPPEGVVNGA
jgi:flagellar biosynthesis anti-sigma factor FlgM